ncbi:MAG TPA: protein-disulfide reductase DsbD, partial [Gammaproteobacteria bacterium]|nr:protein-disulfide reductase DsbD [Gammaproteobacteria bacterium]
GLNSSENEFLPAELAFRPSVSASPDGTALLARWDIQDGYYLYRDKLRVEVDSSDGVTLQAAQFPAGEFKDDETFGRVEVYHGPIEVRVPLTRADAAATTLGIKLSYQGCAEGLICYPPETQTFDVALPASGASAATISAPRPDSDASNSATPTTAPLSEQDQIARILTDKPLWLAMLIFFGLGLGLSVTPCVFPMIPILSSIIVGQGEHITTRRAFTLSLVYVMTMALTYTAAGVIAALFGENLQAAFQDPWILSGFAAVFVLLALSMFGFYDLQMPAALQSRLSSLSNRQRGGTLAGVAVMGFLSALIVGPCVAAPLAAALLVIGQTGDTVLGGSALFALSMGMGAPLLAIGTGAGKLLPRAGGWMNNVKAVFGVLLLAVAIWMLERVLPTTVSMSLWAALLITSAVYMGALEKLDIDATGWHKLWKGIGLILLLYGALVLAGIASGGKDVLQPLRGTAFAANAATATTTSAKLEFRRIKSLADLDREVAQANAQGKSVMLDFFAEWCAECHRLEKNTFSDATVQAALNNTITLQADVTANDAADKALMQRYKLIGPPAILFFDTTGQELNSHRVVGYMDAEAFAAHVRSMVGTKE